MQQRAFGMKQDSGFPEAGKLQTFVPVADTKATGYRYNPTGSRAVLVVFNAGQPPCRIPLKTAV